MSTISVKQLSFAYPGQKPLFTNCHFDISSDWKLGLLGRNGRGKTTMMKILLGQLDYRGTVESQLNFAYFPLTITDPHQLAGSALLAASNNPNLEQWQIERELNLMKTDPGILWQAYATLSGGEQTKAQLAVLLAQENKFFLLDEPTNHLDLTG
ncbi:ATP-binding cassette domain-containing protein [Limosilactobacillus difficilis]|uniref:ATP-binding cassette domain-containing protein n=1 Tax=Limosilactobacillus difficilis TaxID=2991838 RepID=UPI002DD6B2F8|nr:ATP-binding cassette domain-containing protein [Limosilactobacillus difficilis]